MAGATEGGATMSLEITIKELDELKAHLGEALASNFQKQMDPVVRQVEASTTRLAGVEAVQRSIVEDVSRLKANQVKALAVWTLMVGAIGTGVTLGFNYIKGWIFSHLHIS